MHVYFSVGEPSGDQHAAHLIGELRKRTNKLRVTGMGGPLMEAAGLESQYRLTNLAVMGIFRVVPLLLQFYRLYQQAKAFIQREKPDAVVLIDFPGFNWWIAKAAKAAGIPVIYYLPPQLWAWAPWRVRKVRKFVDHVLCGLPFEPDWYARRNIKVDYVGHPFFDEISDHPLDAIFVERARRHEGPLVAILPGSRNQEVNRNWPVMLETMRRLHEQHPGVRFLVANYRESHREKCERETLQTAPALPVEFHTGRTPEIIEAVDCALMVSGSVSLEMVARQTPAVVIYRLLPLPNLLRHWFLQCRFISLPNLIAGREVMPEFVYSNPDAVVPQVSAILDRWVSSIESRDAVGTEMNLALATFRSSGATIRTADFIQRLLEPAAKPAEEQTARAAVDSEIRAA